MKRYIYLLIIFLFLLFPIDSYAIIEPTSDFYVNDYANILSEEIENYIMQKSVALNNVDGTQIVVVTVTNLEGMSLEEYSNEVFNSFGIGDKDKNNGLLLLLALEEREFRVEVGDGLGGILPDGKTGRFQDEYIIPYLKENKWDEGIKNGYDAFYSEIVTQNNLDLDYNMPVSNNSYNSNWVGMIQLLLIAIGFISGCIVGVASNKKRKNMIWLYLVIWAIGFGFVLTMYISLFMAMLINLFIFLRLAFYMSSSRIGHYSSGGSFGGGSFSGSHHTGGGGHSSGGGSSRRF